jgi:hypothetical protein
MSRFEDVASTIREPCIAIHTGMDESERSLPLDQSSAEACKELRQVPLICFESWIVGRYALRLLVELDRDLIVLRVRQPAMPIRHMLAFFLVALGRRPLYPLSERRIHVTHRVVAARRWHHQIPTHKRERCGVAGVHEQSASKLPRDQQMADRKQSAQFCARSPFAAKWPTSQTDRRGA